MRWLNARQGSDIEWGVVGLLLFPWFSRPYFHLSIEENLVVVAHSCDCQEDTT